ncbi:MAG: hypothetical protein K0Q60_4420, partial [Microvirga sp.]|nr:hypothetical protein [Microvirga sp.]
MRGRFHDFSFNSATAARLYEQGRTPQKGSATDEVPP